LCISLANLLHISYLIQTCCTMFFLIVVLTCCGLNSWPSSVSSLKMSKS
jgi:hypothetical protein